MAGNFAPSINIVRDVDRQINYITTPNALAVFEELQANYRTGHRCFSIVGAYGSGKSAFVWAFEKTLTKRYNFFNASSHSPLLINSFRFDHIVGEYGSLATALAAKYLPGREDFTIQDLLKAIEEEHAKLKKAKKGLVLIVDEFGKFLEYAAKHSPEQELYLVQQLAELVNDQNKNIVLLTILHQDFGGYSHSLSRVQKEEWTKVKGRLKELTFNEPVEQLLFLAAEKLADPGKKVENKVLKQLNQVVKENKLYPLNDYFTIEVAKNVYPLDILSASVLTQALQRYGQNERSLFTFLESDERFGLNSSELKGFFNLEHVYDYLNYQYFSYLTSKHNTDFAHWATLRNSLDRVETVAINRVKEAKSLLKTIGLLSIFSQNGNINRDFLEEYGRISLNIKDIPETIVELENHKIIRYTKHKDSYSLFEGTDLDIELAINEAGQLVGNVTDVVQHLKQLFTFPLLQANQVSFDRGTPRFFEFKLSTSPITDSPDKDVDGYINLVFCENLTINKVRQLVGAKQDAVLYGIYKNTSEIKELIWEIEKIKKVREQNPNDKVARRELGDILAHQTRLLNHYVMGSIFAGDGRIEWFFNGAANTNIENRKQLNRCLSQICNEVYEYTPDFRSELVNKARLSSAISTARRKYLKALTQDWKLEDLGFQAKKYPPEKTIYLGLLKNTGIHALSEEGFHLSRPNVRSFDALWRVGEEFIESTKIGERKVSELVEIFQQKPFKLKQGFIDFWLPTFLFCKRGEFALFSNIGFVADTSAEELELLTKNPNEYTLKAFDVDGIKLSFFNQYREIIQKEIAESVNKETFIETIKPFIVFYKGLPTFGKKTKNLTPDSINLREAIAKAKDPEGVFFEDMPQALGYTFAIMQKDADLQEEYITKLRGCIKELQQAYDQLLVRIEKFLAEGIVGCQPQFPQYKEGLQQRYINLTTVQLNQKQRTLLQRIMSPLDDRHSWINSIATVLVNKPLSEFDDKDEELLLETLKKAIYQLDSFTSLTDANINPEMEEAYKLEINSFEDGLHQRIIRLPRQQVAELETTAIQLRQNLNLLDQQQQLLVLTKLLKDIVKDGE